MIIVLVILLAILGVLFYLFLKLNEPPQTAAKVQTKGITWIRSIYGFGKKADQLMKSPTGIGADSRGRIFVADGQNRRVLIFNGAGQYLGRLGSPGMGKGQIAYPQGVDVGPDGTIYVTDTKRNVLMVFGADLKFKDETHGETPLAVSAADSKVFLATMAHIVVMDKNLKVLEKWGRRGRAIGNFDFPHGIGVLKNGVVVVSDGNNMRLQALLNGKGQAVWVVGAPPESVFTRTRAFGLPSGLTLDDDQNIYVMDPLRSTVHVFNDKGKKLGEYGDMGQEEGQFYYPSDITYLGGDEFAISDTFNNRVDIVRITGVRRAEIGPLQSLWDLLKNLWWCWALLLLILAALLFVFFRRRGQEIA